MGNLGTVAGGAGPPLLTIRPSPERIRAVRRRTAPVVGVVAAAAVLRGVAFSGHIKGAALWTVLLILVGGGLLVAQALVSYRLRTRRIVVTDDSFGGTTFLGTPRLWQQGSAARVVRVTLLFGGTGVPAPQWLVLDADSSRLMALNPRIWQQGDLDALTKVLGVPLEDMGERPVKATELRRRLPRAVPWWQAHTTLLGFLAAVIVIAGLAPFAR